MHSIKIKRTNSNDTHFRQFIVLLDKELHGRSYDDVATYDSHNIIEDLNTVVIAYLGDQPVGCACIKKFDQHSMELKRMYVSKEQRGKGIGANILSELENWAIELNNQYMVLETGIKQPEAIALYQKLNYQLTANYPPYTDMKDSICMKKTLVQQ